MNTTTNRPKKEMTFHARSFSKIIYVAIGVILSASLGVSQVPPTSVPQPSAVTPHDYFRTGAGARYLRRAEGDIVTQTLHGNVSVLTGSGANIIVFSGDRGKFLVDAGISVSEAKVKSALNAISPTPVAYVVNTHWHWDHTDGNEWMHQSGATIIAHRNTLKHLSEATHVDDWNWTMSAVSADARPTILVDDKTTFIFAGDTIDIERNGPGHTDGDVWVYFEKADVLALGDTFWNGNYPFIDNQDGGNINDAIKWPTRQWNAPLTKPL